jgi:hypothetical protein
VVECLPSKLEALNSSPSTNNDNKKLKGQRLLGAQGIDTEEFLGTELAGNIYSIWRLRLGKEALSRYFGPRPMLGSGVEGGEKTVGKDNKL